MQWQPGHRLKSRPYEIERELGEGGFGITYKAKDLNLDIPVVIKTPNSKLQRDVNYSKYVENFKKEARQLAKLGLNPHPHIVRVNSLFEEDNLPCIVMDFIPGDSLYDLVQIGGRLSETQALEYIRQIGSALVVCHSLGIIHRDVHPNNILIHGDNGKAVLIDFGIAGTTQTSRNTHSGNRAFAPWEQMAYWEDGNSKTPQVDIYTLAAGFYYLVTGEVPRECLARKYNNRELIEPKELNDHLSQRTNKAIIKGMEVLPENRPSSIQDWLQLLATPQAPPTKPEIPPTSVSEYNPPKAVTRRSWLKYSGLAIGAMGVSLIGKGLWNDSQNPDLTDYKFDVITVNDRGQEINRQQGSAKYFREDLGNGITIEMVKIPGGTFMMGTEDEEIKRLVKKYNSGLYKDESPEHEVTVSGFYMAKFQVTQAQWKQVADLPQVERELKPEPSHFEGENLPVERVSWYDAVEFCQRISKATGKEYRLPSEAEWEYACRAGTTTPFNFGETITSELVNYNGNFTYANEAKGEYREETTPVGSFPANGFGLYDMHGNVWEWCADTWHDSYQGAPNDGSAWTTGGNDTYVLRGGSWLILPRNCRSANRVRIAPDHDSSSFGFRCVAGRTL